MFPRGRFGIKSAVVSTGSTTVFIHRTLGGLEPAVAELAVAELVEASKPPSLMFPRGCFGINSAVVSTGSTTAFIHRTLWEA